MNLYFRFLLLLLKRLFVFRRMDVFEACSTSFRVNLFDLDINLHMNNGRYLSLMDLGRMDLLIRGGIFWSLLFKGYYPVVVSEGIRFKKSLEPFQSFKIVTLIESWDDKDFFIHQKFVRDENVVAEGYIKGRFKQRGRPGSVPTQELFAILGRTYSGPKVSEIAKSLNTLDNQLS